MGAQSFHDSLTNMKMFVVLALAAMAMAELEADPQLLYTAGVHTPVTSINNVKVVNAVPHVYTTGVHAPTVGVVGSTVYSHPTVYYGKRDAEAEPEADAYYGYYGYARPYAYGYRSYGYPAYGYYGKRSADAEPEADADAFYGVYGYSAYRPYAYSAYRPYAYTTRWGYGKRSADAEAEADPALVYTSAVPAVHSVVSSPLVSALTPAATLKTVHTPVTYTHVVAAPAVTYAGVHAVHTPVVNTVGSTVYYGKREAEADPALLYTNAVPAVHSVVGTHAVVGSPLVHHTYAVPTVAKTVVPAVTVAKAADHGVVGTYAGLVHSSHAGICLNNVGVQVPC